MNMNFRTLPFMECERLIYELHQPRSHTHSVRKQAPTARPGPLITSRYRTILLSSKIRAGINNLILQEAGLVPDLVHKNSLISQDVPGMVHKFSLMSQDVPGMVHKFFLISQDVPDVVHKRFHLMLNPLIKAAPRLCCLHPHLSS